MGQEDAVFLFQQRPDSFAQFVLIHSRFLLGAGPASVPDASEGIEYQ